MYGFIKCNAINAGRLKIIAGVNLNFINLNFKIESLLYMIRIIFFLIFLLKLFNKLFFKIYFNE